MNVETITTVAAVVGLVVQLVIVGAGAVWLVATMRGELRSLRASVDGLAQRVDDLVQLDERVARIETLVDMAGLGSPLQRDHDRGRDNGRDSYRFNEGDE